MATDTPVNTLIINKLTEAQYKSATKSPTEVYYTTDSPKPLTTVAHDATLTGAGTTESPLSVVPTEGITASWLATMPVGQTIGWFEESNTSITVASNKYMYITAQGEDLLYIDAEGMYPTRDNTYYLGDYSSKRWNTVYTCNLASGNNKISIPNKAGTMALTEDLPTVSEINGTKIIRIGRTVIITGRVTEASVGAGVATHTAPITLPVTMVDNAYTVLLTPTCGGGLAQLNVDYEDETTTGFTIGIRNVGSTTSTDININWMVIGDEDPGWWS